METPRGTVVSVATRGDRLVATVEVDVSTVCARCAAGRGCGAGLLTGTGSTRQIEALADAGQHLSPGDRVDVSLEPRSILRAAFIAYGFPLAGALAGAAIAYGLSLRDTGASVLSLVGVIFGAALSRQHLKQPACLGRYEPTVSKVI